MNSNFPHIPKDKRKKILLICDDIRVHSGVATVAKEIVLGTAHHFNWFQLAGAIKHPEKGKRFDLSQSVNKGIGINDSYVQILPTDGYGNPQIVRDLLKNEKPDAVMLITDPRYFTWLFQMEAEIRKQCPITYLNIWDSPLPVPMYNRPYYEACDLLMGISKQTVNINRLVLDEKAEDKILRYIPHGLNENVIKPLPKDDPKLVDFKRKLLKNRPADFVLFFNSRNIRRKQIPDAMLAFREFLWSLPEEKARKCFMVLHTEPKSDHGTDLRACAENFFGPRYDLDTGEKLSEETYEDQIIFSTTKYPADQLNLLYNSADAGILLTDNEGFGLTLLENILAGNPIIANVQGGMQDQMRFEDEEGNWIDFNRKFLSNHCGTYKKHGEWAFPVYPTSRSIQGSIPTPFIASSRCRWEDAAERIKEIYQMKPEERKRRGLKGREWATSDEAGMTTKHQADKVIEAFNTLFDTWTGREKFDIINATTHTGRHINHAIIY